MGENNKSHPPTYEIEYITYNLDALTPPSDWPIPQHHLPDELRNLTELTPGLTSEVAPYGLKDLTIKNYIR
jgi:endopolyphosphatase